MKESVVLTLAEVNIFLNSISEQWPIKYGAMFQQVQQFFIDKFKEDKVNNEETVTAD